MSNRILKRWTMVVCTSLLFMASCQTPPGCVRPEITETVVTATFSPTLSPIAPSTPSKPTPTIRATYTASPSSTIVVPTPFILAPTITPQIPEATPWPTLSPTEEEAYSLAQLSTNGGCKLPCWWGIRPGTTTVSETTALSTLLGPLPYTDSYVEYYYPIETDHRGFGNLDIRIAVDQGIMQRISLSTDVLQAPRLSEAMQTYSLRRIMTLLGTPSRAFIELTGGPSERDAPWLYQLWIFYDTQGLVAYYEGEGMSLNGRGDTLQVCPAPTVVRWMKLHIVASPDDPVLGEVEKGIQSDISEGYMLPLEKAIGMKLNEFQSAITANSNTCFESPANLW